MEKQTLLKIKKKASDIIENRLLKTGFVLAVRKWEPSTLIEIDLHLPSASIHAWNEVPYIKFKVADFTYRDYTPSGWDAETQTCTLFIDAAHQGPGSTWAHQLRAGDQISYLKISSTHHSPVNTSSVICMGDESSIGHLLAMQQLTLPATRFSGAVVISNERHRNLFSEYFRSSIEPVSRINSSGYKSLINWLENQYLSPDNTIFYLAGYNGLVIQLRRLLKSLGYSSRQIKSQGFWS